MMCFRAMFIDAMMYFRASLSNNIYAAGSQRCVHEFSMRLNQAPDYTARSSQCREPDSRLCTDNLAVATQPQNFLLFCKDAGSGNFLASQGNNSNPSAASSSARRALATPVRTGFPKPGVRLGGGGPEHGYGADCLPRSRRRTAPASKPGMAATPAWLRQIVH